LDFSPRGEDRRVETMKRMTAVFAVMLIAACVVAIAGCKKRYIPRVSEEIIDPGVVIHSETVVE
jgi:hypothetical protein